MATALATVRSAISGAAPGAATLAEAAMTADDLIRHRACAAWCWTAVHAAELIPADGAETLRRQLDATDIILHARALFPHGVPITVDDPLEAAVATLDAIAAGADVVFDGAALTDDGLFARVDVLVRRPDGRWALIDILSTTSRADTDHRVSVAWRCIVFSRAGYVVDEVAVLRLDRDYVRGTEAVEPSRLFTLDPTISAWVDAHLAEIEDTIDDARAVLAGHEQPPPCTCDRRTRSKRCPVFALFHPRVPSGDSVYDLVSINQGHLIDALDRGVTRLAHWPPELRLNARQRWQVEAARTGRQRVQAEPLRAFLDTITLPCAFLDYEAVQLPVPIYPGTRPYQQVPVQYSLHTVDVDGLLHHREFLWTDRDASPLVPLAEALRRDIGDAGAVVVWWKGFESRRNEEMAEAAPHLAPFLLGLNDRMVDLMDAVSLGYWVHPDFRGSTSIKKVLPVAAPELAYDRLPIGGGAVATLRWRQCVVDSAPPDGQTAAEVFDQLREYCRRDTLALVRIWQHLHRLVDIDDRNGGAAGSTP